MSLREKQFNPSRTEPAARDTGEPLISIRDLKLHFDLGADLKLGFGKLPRWLRIVMTVASILIGAALGLKLGLMAGLSFINGPWQDLIIALLFALIVAFLTGTLVFYFLRAIIVRAVVGAAAHRIVKAVDGVTLDIYAGETLGLVGESGCGKSSLGRAILRLAKPTAGQVLFRDRDLAHLSNREMREHRRHLQIVFQDPYASLNPRMTVGQIVREPLDTFKLARGREAEQRVQELLETVGLSKRFIKRYPHEFSGGQRQRIGIARALAVDPDFIVADEPISALDVSIQAQIMNLMERLQREKNLTYLFISHDLRAIRHVSDRIAVMYLGKLVEVAAARTIYAEPLMPYTKALISAVPVPDPRVEATRQRIVLEGDVPSPINPPAGCRFHTRCPYVIEACKEVVPPLVEIKPSHFAACIRISPEQPAIDNVAPGDAPGLAAALRQTAEGTGVIVE
jgi:oligopeptide transport system ATP-binding protein